MVRIDGKTIVDVGPRSAHIAGLRYSTFADTDEIVDPEVILVQPKPKDPADYVAIRCSNGKTFAITNTCAANVLGVAKKGDFAYGNPEAARKAIEALARKLSLSVEATAKRILEISSEKIKKVITQLITEYKLDKDTTILVGGGGGACALIPFVAKEMSMDYKISENAEVISSIGVALAMVRDVVERTVINPTPEDLVQIRREAMEAAIRSGAAPETIEVFVEIDGHRKRIRAIALGATELRTKDLSQQNVSMEEAKLLVTNSMRTTPENVNLIANTDFLSVFTANIKGKGFSGFLKGTKKPVRVIDKRGVIRLSISDGIVLQSWAERALGDLDTCLVKFASWSDAGCIIPRVFLVHGSRISDLSGLLKPEQVSAVASLELKGLKPKDPVIFVLETR
jgi:DNA-binding Lrp family transcriptional regulator